MIRCSTLWHSSSCMVLLNVDWLWSQECFVHQVMHGENLICFCPEETGVIFNKDVVAGPAICNATHMTVAIPAFPGTLMAVGAEDKTIPMDRLQENGIALDRKTGVKLHISREVLKSRVSSDLQVTAVGLITTPWCLVKAKATVLWFSVSTCQVSHVSCGWLRAVVIKRNV